MIARVWRGVVRAEDADEYAAIEAFAGEDIDRAVYYPEDDRYLLERDQHVVHYQVPDQ